MPHSSRARRLREAHTAAVPSSSTPASFFCPSQLLLALPLTLVHDSHAAGGPLNDLDRALEIGGIQVGHLLLGDFRQLLARNFSDFVLLRDAGSFNDACRLLQQV